MERLSNQAPKNVWLPCMSMEPGPRKTAALAYSKESGWLPMNGLGRGAARIVSRASTTNITRPVMTNARLPKVFNGSRMMPPETRSHQREISPIGRSLAAGVHQPSAPPRTNSAANTAKDAPATAIGR